MTESLAHPRFAAALHELGLDVEIRRLADAKAVRETTGYALDPKSLIAHAGGALVDVRERTA